MQASRLIKPFRGPLAGGPKMAGRAAANQFNWPRHEARRWGRTKSRPLGRRAMSI